MRLVESGKLISVTPSIPSPEIFIRANEYKSENYGKNMHPRTCEPNARALVKAMPAEERWAVVGGFAVGPRPEYPTRHVWVRKDDSHFDPTWSLRVDSYAPFTHSLVPVAEYSYFALPSIFPEGDVRESKGLHYLTDMAGELGIELLENHQFDSYT